jgi:oligoendopeptidase F
LKELSAFAESEINAVYNYKKVDDELRGYSTPYESTLLENQNSIKTIDTLVKTVTENFDISQDFYALQSEILQLKELGYQDRSLSIGEIKKEFDFDSSTETVLEALAPLKGEYVDILKSYLQNGQIDVFPKQDKRGGAYMSGAHDSASLVLLNHVNNFTSLQTYGHEMGHAFHTELSKKNQTPINFPYSTSTAETASTFFEQIVFNHVLDNLSNDERKMALFERTLRDVETIFRQVACFNFELELHTAVRSKGFVKKDEIAQTHNRNMQAYLGSKFKLDEVDGYLFVTWPHLRYYFYVYTYAYGLLVSKVLLKRYKENPAYLEKIEQFLKSGGSDSPENIFKKIGIDLTKKEFFQEGLDTIREDVKNLRKMLK